MIKSFLGMMMLSLVSSPLLGMDSIGNSPRASSSLESSLSKSLEIITPAKAEELIERARAEGYQLGCQDAKREIKLLRDQNKLLHAVADNKTELYELMCEDLEALQERYTKLKAEIKKTHEELHAMVHQPRQPLTTSQLARAKTMHLQDFANGGKLLDILEMLKRMSQLP